MALQSIGIPLIVDITARPFQPPASIQYPPNQARHQNDLDSMLGKRKKGKNQVQQLGKGQSLSRLPLEVVERIVEYLRDADMEEGHDEAAKLAKKLRSQHTLAQWRSASRHFAQLLGPVLFAEPVIDLWRNFAMPLVDILIASPKCGAWVLQLALLRERWIRDGEMEQVLANTPSLQYLDVEGCQQLTDKFCKHLVQRTPLLDDLTLSLCTAITDLGVGVLHGLRALIYLDLSGLAAVTDTGLMVLLSPFPDAGSAGATPAMSPSPLETLDVRGTSITTATLEHLLGLPECAPSLTSLHVSGIPGHHRYIQGLAQRGIELMDDPTWKTAENVAVAAPRRQNYDYGYSDYSDDDRHYDRYGDGYYDDRRYARYRRW
jgi:hypothetical protein